MIKLRWKDYTVLKLRFLLLTIIYFFLGWEKLNLNMGAFNTAISTFKDLEPLMNKIKPIFNNYLKSTLK